MNSKNIITITTTLIYALITLIAVLNHEIWADEAQVWLLCKHLSIPELFAHLHNEGHPSLMYLITMPFAKIFPDIIAMQIICWFIMCISVFILFQKSPFPLIVKYAIISSAGFLYFFPVIARSYSIIPILVFLTAILYSKRKENPILYAIILFLLANTHIIMFGFVGILTSLHIVENIKEKSFSKKNIISLIIMILGILAVILQLHDSVSSNSCINIKGQDIISNIFKIITLFFVNTYNYQISATDTIPNPIIDLSAIILLIISFVLLTINLFVSNKKLFIILLLSIGFQFSIYIFAYNAYIYVTRIFSAYIILLFCFWILYKDNSFNENNTISKKRTTTILLSIFLFLSTFNGINYYILDLKGNYSSAKDTANFIRKNIDINSSILLIRNEAYSISLAYELGNDANLYSITRDNHLKYVTWDEKVSKKMSCEDWLEYCKKISNNYENIYIISTKRTMNEELDNDFEHIYTAPKTFDSGEQHFIHRYKK